MTGRFPIVTIRRRRRLWVSYGIAVTAGVLALSLGACAQLKQDWPNLATVPSREEAFPQPEKSPVYTAKNIDSSKAAASRQEDVKAVTLSLTAIGTDLSSLDRAFAENQANIATEAGAYEKVVDDLAAASSAIKAGSDALITAELYLSRVARSRDALRNIRDKIELRQRDLGALKAPIKALDETALGRQCDDLAGRAASLLAKVTEAAERWNDYTGQELNRMAFLSADDLDRAAILSPETDALSPALRLGSGQTEADQGTALHQMLASLGGKTAQSRFLIIAVGSGTALTGRNAFLVKLMADLMTAKIPLSHITLGVRVDPAQQPMVAELYIESR